MTNMTYLSKKVIMMVKYSEFNSKRQIQLRKYLFYIRDMLKTQK